MKVLLDAPFPVALLHRLRRAGWQAEQVKAPLTDDARLWTRLEREAFVFLTQDEEFADIPADFGSQVILSSLWPWRPIAERVEICFGAIAEVASRDPRERLFEILPHGVLATWEILELGRCMRWPT